jgi:hypothetical protein
MYGWAWLLALAQELHGWDDPDGRLWSASLEPLEKVIVDLIFAYLPKLTYPIRVGTHQNTAFALCLIRDYAVASVNDQLRGLVDERATHYFAKDRNYPAFLEPSGADFLSPALTEAELMRRVFQAADFRTWFSEFLPDGIRSEPVSLFEPAIVSDVADPQIGHLIGLNLSRAWCLKGLAGALKDGEPLKSILTQAAESHFAAAWPFVESGHYEGEHWLATYAAMVLTGS